MRIILEKKTEIIFQKKNNLILNLKITGIEKWGDAPPPRGTPLKAINKLWFWSACKSVGRSFDSKTSWSFKFSWVFDPKIKNKNN